MKTFRFSIAAFAIALVWTVSASGVFAQDEEKGPPLPFHTIEGVGGGAITPIAYLVNPAPEGTVFGKPAIAASYAGLGSKNLDALTITETLWGRVELGFGADRLGLGTLPDAIHAYTPFSIDRSDVWLYNFNARGLLVKENYNDFQWMPAIVVGACFKTNEGIRDVNRDLGGALTGIGYARENGTDFTLTASKTIKTPGLGMPIVLTGGIRESQAANLGFLGFGDTYRATFEGSIAVIPHERWIIAYEFREKKDPYTMGLAPVLGDEDNWQAFDVAYILNKHTTLCVGTGAFGTLANDEVNNPWWMQLKYEF
jgi:hypothetical protein